MLSTREERVQSFDGSETAGRGSTILNLVVERLEPFLRHGNVMDSVCIRLVFKRILSVAMGWKRSNHCWTSTAR
jgi:hypothetical protein